MILNDRLIESIKNGDLVDSSNIDICISYQKSRWDNKKYFFDEKEARRIFKFVGKLTFDKGKKGEPIQLLFFQFKVITDILCVKRRKDNKRRFREVHINIPRKNGKSFLVAIIIAYLYFFKTEFGSEYIISANTTTQAGLLYNTIIHFIDNSPLKTVCKKTESRRIVYRKDQNSYIRVISSDAKNADSFADLIFCMDEIHEAANQKLYDKLKTGQGIWEEPLGITITTASSGEDPFNLESEIYNLAKSIEKGEFEDETFYYAIFEAEEGCDIMDEKQWYLANPALGKFRKLEDLAALAKRATQSKLREISFRRFFLNQHISVELNGAIDMILWQRAVDHWNEMGLTYERICDLENWSGLDLSARCDITAQVQCFYAEDIDKYIIYPHLYTPQGTIIERKERDKVPYDEWVDKGYLIDMKGNYINFNQLHSHIKARETNEIYFDRWGSPATQSALEDDFDIVGFGQGFRSMTPIINTFEELLIDDRLIICDNPVLTWMARNTVAVIDDAGNIKYSKKRSKNKIDGIIAMVMSLQGAVNSSITPDVLYSPDIEDEEDD